jgi:hypothetical protein
MTSVQSTKEGSYGTHWNWWSHTPDRGYIYAIVIILQSSAKNIEKLIWFLVVLLLPLIGLIIWYFAGPGKKPF